MQLAGRQLLETSIARVERVGRMLGNRRGDLLCFAHCWHNKTMRAQEWGQLEGNVKRRWEESYFFDVDIVCRPPGSSPLTSSCTG